MILITKQEKELLINEFKKNGNIHKVKFDKKQGFITHDFFKVFYIASINKSSAGKSHYTIDKFADLAKKLIMGVTI